MKHSVKQLLREKGCPKHDYVFVKYKNSQWTRIEEHELRFLCLLVVRGEVNKEDILIREINGRYLSIEEDGQLSDRLYSNIYSLTFEIHREKSKINRRKQNNL